VRGAAVPQTLFICCEPGVDLAAMPDEVARTALCFERVRGTAVPAAEVSPQAAALMSMR
jgi:hypothetical protein